MQQEGENEILRELEELRLQEGASKVKIELCREEIKATYDHIATMLAQRNRPPAKGFTLVDIAAVWPLVSEYAPQDRTRFEEELALVEQELRQLEQQELELSKRLQTGGEKLDLEQASKRMEQQDRSYQTKKHGGLLIEATRDRLMRKMIPRIEYYIHQLLPVLTLGRYHDVQLTTEPEEGVAGGGAFQLSIWEAAAGEYIAKSALSGGTADQISLALRLAFAIAALPRELGTAPGFLLLDEPLSSSSRDRMQALLKIVTGDMLEQHFEQILFITHDSAFERAMFPYHIYVEDGVIVETNLPVATAYAPIASAHTSAPLQPEANGHSNGLTQVPEPASQTP
jgi:DNA repair exonuclease SbcCD ATPase subunit